MNNSVSSEQRVTVGGRSYTVDQYRRIARENRAAAGPLLVTIGAVVIYTALVALIAGLMPREARLEGVPLLVAGVLIAVIPALIWLFAFYQQDRLEPEPKEMVFAIFLLGGLLAAAIGQPLLRNVFHVQDWLGNNLLTGLLGSILVVGFVQEALKYAAVRYTAFRSSEFDERVDGIVYMAAAGLGYATAMNLEYILGNGGVNLGVGVIQTSINALAQASFAGVVGYFMGRAKFDNMGPFWMPLGLTLAAVLNGVVTYLLGEVTSLGTTVRASAFNNWLGLIVAVIIAGATFAVLFVLIRRLNAATLARIKPVGA
jgi:RsiW-degrading membrane proteinase PrsW (M82 family)